MNPTYPATWYVESADKPPERPALSKSVHSDVCVVGAGLAGLTTSLELLRQGKSIVLLEANRVAWGASGRNAGFVCAGFAEDLPNIAAGCGLETARRLFGYSQLGVEYVRDTIRQLDPCLQMGAGVLEAMRHPDRGRSKRAIDEMSANYSYHCEFQDKKKVQQSLKTSRYSSATFDPSGFHIHPLNYALLLAREIEKLGGNIFEASPATKFAGSAKNLQISTPSGNVSARQVVLCTSAYDDNLFPPLSRAILPVSTHIVVTESLGDSTNPIQTRAAISDSRRAGDYYRLINKNRLMWGGKISTRQSPPNNLDATMLNSIRSVFPQLENVRVDFRWSGLMAYCLHKMPIIGEIQPGVWAATGFGGHGINTTAMAGVLVAAGIGCDDQRWLDFSRYRARWAGGSIGRTGVQISYWAMQARDWMDERRS